MTRAAGGAYGNGKRVILISREIEAGTLRLAWTQGVTRARWLAVKLGLVGLASMAAAGCSA